MSNDVIEEPVTVHELTEIGREKLAQAQVGTRDALGATAALVKANPLAAIVAAAVLGGALVALTRPSRPSPRNRDLVRDWLDEAYAKLPSRDEVQSIAESSGLPRFFKQLARTLHLSS